MANECVMTEAPLEWHEFLDSLDKLLVSSRPPSEVLQSVREAVEAKRDLISPTGNLDATLAVPSIQRSAQFPSVYLNDESGLVEALRQSVLKHRALGGSAGQGAAARPFAVPALQLGSTPTLNSKLLSVRANEPREQAFARCFPQYAKHFAFQTQKTGFLLRRARPNFSSALCAEAQRFVLCSAVGAWFLYSLPEELDNGPALVFQGTLDPDPHFYVCINTLWFVVASSAGVVRVFSLHTGELLWKHQLKFALHALCMSPSGAYIACAISPVAKETGETRPMVVLLCPDVDGVGKEAFAHVAEINFASPYRDVVKNLTFAPDELYLLCATDEESRFFIVSLLDPHEPRLVMRSSRKVPHDGSDYEGITSAAFFSRRSGLVVTSVAANSPPIVIDPKLGNSQGAPDASPTASKSLNQPGHYASHSSSSSRLAPSLIFRVDKVGSCIHRAVVSPRENVIAFLDKNGHVYLLHWPKSLEQSKKFVVVFELSPAPSFRTAASLQFSPDGTVLYAIDRRGTLHIADFGAGMPNSAGITKLRVLS